MNVQLSKPFAAYVATPAGKDLSTAVARHCGWDPREIHPGGLAAAARLVDAAPLAGVVLVEVGKMPLDMACESVAELAKFGSEVLVVAQNDSPDAFRAFRRAGAEDFFTFPVKLADVLQVVQRRGQHDIAPPAPNAQVVGVISTRGGVGGSLLAANLAATAAADPARSVALVDLDFRFGTLATDLNHDATSGLFEALSAPERIDRTFLDASMAAVAPNLMMYSSQAGLDQDLSSYEGALPDLVKRMSPMFDTIVLDIPREIVARHPQVLAALGHVVLTFPPGFGGLNTYSRLSVQCAHHAPEARIVPVLSEVRQDAKISRKDLAKALQTKLTHILPRSEAQITKAQVKGRPLVTMLPRARYSKAVRSLWQDLHSDSAAKQR